MGTIVMDATERVVRGWRVLNTGSPITVPIGRATLGRITNKGDLTTEHYLPIHKEALSFVEQATEQKNIYMEEREKVELEREKLVQQRGGKRKSTPHRNQFNHHHHHPIPESDPNPQIPSIIQSTRGKSTISSLLLCTFSNNTPSSNNDIAIINATAQSKKKTNFSAATSQGCTIEASQQVLVSAVIRSSADWQGKKTTKKKYKRTIKSLASVPDRYQVIYKR
ncbi:hypothetical protein V8G54_007426 [Vigna mungo]|uniref:H(+)-transporting two-sector ATPase n=1 Tax=Vigna mungo TaxID=3915 RepID=A0AAQ3S922_VIGMU